MFLRGTGQIADSLLVLPPYPHQMATLTANPGDRLSNNIAEHFDESASSYFFGRLDVLNLRLLGQLVEAHLDLVSDASGLDRHPSRFSVIPDIRDSDDTLARIALRPSRQ